MKGLKYPQGSEKCVWPYFSTMRDLDKTLNAEAFNLNGKTKTKYIIFIDTDTYGIEIDNPDIKLVIQ